MSDEGESASAISGSEQGASVTSLRDIEGFWLIERFGEFEPSWHNGTPWRSAYVQIDYGRMTYSVGCNRSGSSVSLGSDGILHDTDDGSSMQTLIGCGSILEARDQRFFAFFGSNPEVRTVDAGRISLKSDLGEVVLVRPDIWLQVHKPDFSEIEGQWVPQVSSTYDGWGSAGSSIGDEQGIVTIERSRVRWSLCPELPIPIQWSNDARLASRDEVDVSDCPAVDRAMRNGPGAVMRMLTANPFVIRTSPDHIVLVDGSGDKGRRLDLQSVSVLNPPPLPPMRRELIPPPPPPAPAPSDTSR